MQVEQYKAKMLGYSLAAGKVLCEMTMDMDIKKEPEQARKNVATILTLMTETEDFVKSLSLSNVCSKL